MRFTLSMNSVVMSIGIFIFSIQLKPIKVLIVYRAISRAGLLMLSNLLIISRITTV